MLHHPTYDRLAELGLQGTAAAFTELIADPQAAGLDHATWLGLLLDREATRRWTGDCKPGSASPGCATPRPGPKTSTTERHAGSTAP